MKVLLFIKSHRHCYFYVAQHMQSVYVIIRAHTVKAHLSWLKQNNPPASYALLLVYLSELVL